MAIHLQRSYLTEPGVVLFVMPFGTKMVGPEGSKEPFDFNWLYKDVLAPATVAAGLTPERVDGLYGPVAMVELIWRAVQRCELAVMDFSAGSGNVALELGWAMALGKRFVSLTQDPEQDIPSDIRGIYRYIKYSEKGKDIDELRRELPQYLLALRDEEAIEMTLSPIGGGATQAVATVTFVDKDYVTVRTPDGSKIGNMRSTDVDYSRVYKDMHRRFKVGDELRGAFVYDAARQESRYTLLANQENPWPQLASKYPIGAVFEATVTNTVETTGVFVRILGQISGLIPRSTIAGEFPPIGAQVEVEMVSLSVKDRLISLQLRSSKTVTHTAPVVAMPAIGDTFDGEVVKVDQGDNGYVLLRLEGYERAGRLRPHDMLDDLRADFLDGEVKRGEMIRVKVVACDAAKRTIRLKDLGESADQVAADPKSQTETAA